MTENADWMGAWYAPEHVEAVKAHAWDNDTLGRLMEVFYPPTPKLLEVMTPEVWAAVQECAQIAAPEIVRSVIQSIAIEPKMGESLIENASEGIAYISYLYGLLAGMRYQRQYGNICEDEWWDVEYERLAT